MGQTQTRQAPYQPRHMHDSHKEDEVSIPSQVYSVSMKRLAFNSIKLVIFTRLESSISKKAIMYKIDTVTGRNVMPFKVFRILFPIFKVETSSIFSCNRKIFQQKTSFSQFSSMASSGLRKMLTFIIFNTMVLSVGENVNLHNMLENL